ncbi:15930_t:CDS:2, partial [Dentiscutata erythropus]
NLSDEQIVNLVQSEKKEENEESDSNDEEILPVSVKNAVSGESETIVEFEEDPFDETTPDIEMKKVININITHSDHVDFSLDDKYSDENEENKFENNDDVQNNLKYELEDLKK